MKINKYLLVQVSVAIINDKNDKIVNNYYKNGNNNDSNNSNSDNDFIN